MADTMVDFFNQNIKDNKFISLPIYRGVHELINQIVDDKRKL